MKTIRYNIGIIVDFLIYIAIITCIYQFIFNDRQPKPILSLLIVVSLQFRLFAKIRKIITNINETAPIVCDHPIDDIIRDGKEDYCIACGSNIPRQNDRS